MFKIKGKPTVCSREFVRAWLHACVCVLAYHGKLLPLGVVVRIVARCSEDAFGTWEESTHTIRLRRDLDSEEMATTILHEVIHAACGHFGDDTDEKCCSTLTARLKPDVQLLAQTLIDGTYRRAAYIAHTKLTYRTDDDHYDDDQERPVGADDRYQRCVG